VQAGSQVVFRNVPVDASILARIRERLAALRRIDDDILRCHVDVERVERGGYRAFVQLTLRRGDVSREFADEESEPYDSAEQAVDAAFDEAAQRLTRPGGARTGPRANASPAPRP
jgi:ribosome-associated translation inhibitor RaiA